MEVVELLGSSQIVNCINERLFSHGDNLFANILDDVVFKSFVLIIVFILIGNWLKTFLLLDFSIVKLFQKVLILLMHSILFFLNGFNYFALSLQITWSAIAVTWYFISLVVPHPFDLCHVNPRFRLRFQFNCWSISVNVGGSSNILSGESTTNIKMFSALQSNKWISFWNNDDSTLNRKLHGWLDRLAVNHPCSLKLLLHFGADFVNNFQHALLHQVFTWLSKFNLLI